MVNFYNQGCKAEVNGGRWGRVTIVLPTLHRAAPPQGVERGVGPGVSSVNTTRAFFLLSPYLSSTSSSPSLGRGSVRLWHGSLGKQGKDWLPVGSSKHLPNSNNIIVTHAANGLRKPVWLVGERVVTDDWIPAQRLPAASGGIRFPKRPEKPGQAASHRLCSVSVPTSHVW